MAVVRDRLYFYFRPADIVGWAELEGGKNKSAFVGVLNLTAGSWPVHFEPFGDDQVLIFTLSNGIYVYNETDGALTSLLNSEAKRLYCGPYEYLQFQELVYFMGTTVIGGGIDQELWVTGGTLDGTIQVADLNPRAGNSFPEGFVATENRFFFTAFDGEVKNLYTSANRKTQEVSSMPEGSEMVLDQNWGRVVKNNTILVRANHPTLGEALWTLNDVLKFNFLDAFDSPSLALSMEMGSITSTGEVLFTTNKGTPSDPMRVWISDGTRENTLELLTLSATSERIDRRTCMGKQYKRYKEDLYFTVFIPQPPLFQHYTFQLFKTSGTAEETSLVFSTTTGARTCRRELFIEVNDRIYFPLCSGSNLTAWELWVTEGSHENTSVQPIDWSGEDGSSSLNTDELYILSNTILIPQINLWALHFPAEIVKINTDMTITAETENSKPNATPFGKTPSSYPVSFSPSRIIAYISLFFYGTW